MPFPVRNFIGPFLLFCISCAACRDEPFALYTHAFLKVQNQNPSTSMSLRQPPDKRFKIIVTLLQPLNMVRAGLRCLGDMPGPRMLLLTRHKLSCFRSVLCATQKNPHHAQGLFLDVPGVNRRKHVRRKHYGIPADGYLHQKAPGGFFVETPDRRAGGLSVKVSGLPDKQTYLAADRLMSTPLEIFLKK